MGMQNILTYIFLLPILVAFVMLFIPDGQWRVFRRLSLATTFVQLALSMLLMVRFDQKLVPENWETAFQFVEQFEWINMSLGSLGSIRIQYYLGVDGISLTLVVLSSFILLIGVISSWNIQQKAKGYFILYLILSASIIGCFIALDFFLFYLCFEFMLLPMFFLIGIWGGKRRSYASVKFFLYTLFGSLFILIVMIGLYLSVADGDTYTFSLVQMMDGNYIPGSIFDPDSDHKIFGYSARGLAFLALMIGFGIKLPMVPMHTWLPDAHVEAPTPISVVLAGLLLKVGAYGMLRVAYGIFPDMAFDYAFIVAILGVLSIIYGGLNALAQGNLKRMVAYSSISHMGFVLVGFASMTIVGFSGALFQMISHGLISSALFLIVGVLHDRTGDREIENFSGLANKMPVYTFFVALFFFAGLGLPGLSGFVGELMILMGAYGSSQLPVWIGILSMLGMVISASYFLWTIQRVFYGKYFVRKADWEVNMLDISVHEKIMLIPLVVFVILLGIFPKLILDYSNETIIFFIQQMSNSQP